MSGMQVQSLLPDIFTKGEIMPAWMNRITLKEIKFIELFFHRKGDTEIKRLDKAEALFAKAELIEEQARHVKSLCYEVLRRK